MLINQAQSLLNSAMKSVLGETAVVNQDLSNVVDLGTEILNANATSQYLTSLIDHIGKVVFVNRPYVGRVPKVLRDGWEFGSILEKVQMDLPEAQEDEAWSLVDGSSVDQNIVYKPSISVKFFNKVNAFMIPMTITEMQVKESFSNAVQLNAFLDLIYSRIETAMSVYLDEMIMFTINNFIGNTIYDEYSQSSQYPTKTGVRAINLLKKYKDATGDSTITTATALTKPEFLRYASKEISLTIDRMSKISSLFNIGRKQRFTPRDLMHVVLHSEFTKASAMYLQSDTFHNELTALPLYDEIPYWQGSGEDYSFSETTKIDITTSDQHEITISGVLGCLFDRDALGVTNEDRRVTTHYNAKGEFYNNYYKYKGGLFNDANENFVVFFIA